MSLLTERVNRIAGGALAIAVLAAWITPFQRDLFIGDETKYGQVVREMRHTGAFFLPTLNGVPFTHKPPLHFWIVDLLTVPLGINSLWAFVLPSLLMLLLLLWLMWRMGGPVAAFVCITSLMVWGSAQTARMDVSFTAFLVLGAWMMLRAFERDDGRAMLGSGVALGIATLIKGPMAPVIGIVLYGIEAWRRHRRPRAADLGAFAVMAAVPLAWFVPAMAMGGAAYTHEVIMKQTVGRAVSAWVHHAPVYFYLLHLPLDLFPWFIPALFALRRANRFYLSWIVAVLVPYSLISSKLDIYMMAMIPAVALMIGDAVRERRFGTGPNLVSLALLLFLGIAGLVIPVARLKGPEAAMIGLPSVRMMFAVLAAAALVALIATWRSLLGSTLAVGLVPIVMMIYLAAALMPMINDIASTRRLIAALERQHVPADRIALYSCPELWSRDLPPELERVRYVDAQDIDHPAVIATSRAHAAEIAPALTAFHRVESVRMIGKRFDVYRR
ncbi:MAG TPA: glycosyltransferase family 39 protein [Thermoanaerobaculia bacterium]|nr:glycosyltransferase family 39 protein [Thermoanaerobaculia bacterium]